MKMNVATLILCAIAALSCSAQSDKKEIENAILSFAKAADARNLPQLKLILHDEFRLSMNRLFGSETLSVLAKADYLKMFEDGKFGGENRKIEILETEVIQNTAHATVRFKGSSLSFQSYLHFVKNSGGKWQLLNDLPSIISN